ncbi:MAG: GntR family transcriptional regulator [Gammaproteobacteria bacterium]|nr:GntR family transcriptional regulator [Gammaproteobacteria bacterium]
MKKPKHSEPAKSSQNMPLTEQALVYLRDAIRTGKLNPGQEIDYAGLAQELSMSRTPIRESVRQLLTEGLLELMPGRTVCVTQVSSEEAESFYQVLHDLEIAAARAAAVHISDLEIKMLKANLSIFNDSKNEPEKLSQIDSQFHNLIYGACNNKYLSQTLKVLRIRIGLLKVQSFDKPARIKSAYREHMEIFKALKSHDPNLAEKAISKHISNARKYRLSLL